MWPQATTTPTPAAAKLLRQSASRPHQLGQECLIARIKRSPAQYVALCLNAKHNAISVNINKKTSMTSPYKKHEQRKSYVNR